MKFWILEQAGIEQPGYTKITLSLAKGL